MSQVPPPPSPQSSQPASGPSRPTGGGGGSGQGEGRPLSFFVAIFLGLLLLLSGGLNIVLLFVSVVSSAAGGLAPVGSADDGQYRIVEVDGGTDGPAAGDVLRVPIQGAIAEAVSPVMGASGGTVSQVRRALSYAARTASVKAVLLDINSPGGGVTDSEEIHRRILEFREEHGKPVYALFGDMSASGGYYIAAPCEKIFARPTTITGSIGVIVSAMNFSKLAEDVGVEMHNIHSERTPYKSMLSPFEPVKEDEKAIVRSIVDEMYERFVEVVADGRGMSKEQVYPLADGRIYSAQQALDNRLVDGVSHLPAVIEMIREAVDVTGLRVIEQRRLPTLGDLLFGGAGVQAAPELGDVAAGLLTGSSGPRFLYYWEGGR